MLPISTAFIVAMVGMDQAVCWLLCYETPKVCLALLPRRHHCRHCGRAVCQECPSSQTWCSLTYPTPPFPFFPLPPPLGQGKTITFGPRAMATHVVYGFLNCKTYSIILLLLLSAQGCQINLTIWALE